MNFTDTYRCCAISTAMLTDDDQLTLASKESENMVMVRDTGFFMKLYEELESVHLLIADLSAPLKHTILEAFHQGFRMIEFDCDAPLIADSTRVNKAAAALSSYMVNDDKDAALTDLLTDLMHWSQVTGTFFSGAHNTAFRHYVEER